MKKKLIFFLVSVLLLISLSFFYFYFYKRDKNKFEPRLWIGFFDYRLNFRDVGESLNQCMGKNIFQTQKIYRSNRYFSGWSCNKINNPDKIYSLNYSPWNPHAYYCEQNNGTRLIGYHPNTTFEISDIENLSNWQRPEFKNTMCIFFKDMLNDLIENKSFLYHCDIGRDRTGTYTAMLSMMLAEQKFYGNKELINAIECDYEKTSSLEKDKIGRMKNFLLDMEKNGGVSKFIENQCGIEKQALKAAADKFINSP